MIQALRFNPLADDSAHTGEMLVGRIIMRSNNSLSWRATKYFLALLLTISMTIALFFTLQGYWMILLFSALEMCVVSGCFYLIVRRAQQQQVVEFTPEHIRVEAGRRNREVSIRWQRFFTKILVQPAKHPWYDTQVQLRCRDQAVELGPFLNAEEKQQLVSDLQVLVALADECRTRT